LIDPDFDVLRPANFNECPETNHIDAALWRADHVGKFESVDELARLDAIDLPD
jgi:hypothetical protein